MNTPSYEDAMNEALDRLDSVGFEQADGFPSHATMAAEALACLGYRDQVAGWVEWNTRYRSYSDQPAPTAVISADEEQDWRAALGARGRAADWAAMFERQIAEHGWRDVLAAWWPRLLPGAIGGLTHGLIRTAHAVRGAGSGQPPSALQLRELARGLGLWAAVFTPLPGSPPSAGREDRRPRSPEEVQTALGELTLASAQAYAASPGPNPVPLVHTVTAPAAVRLVLPSLPAELHDVSLRTIEQVVRTLAGRFASLPANARQLPGRPAPEDLTAETVKAGAAEVKDEHAIKLAEAVTREYARQPDRQYLAASWVLTQRMEGGGHSVPADTGQDR